MTYKALKTLPHLILRILLLLIIPVEHLALSLVVYSVPGVSKSRMDAELLTFKQDPDPVLAFKTKLKTFLVERAND